MSLAVAYARVTCSRIGYRMTTVKVITQCHLVAMLSHYLKELKAAAIQCLGIKPKAINK